MDEKKLVFVYNADSDVISIVKDFWKKILRPGSYQCRLCGVTYGAFSMKKDWKNFIKNLNIDTEFLHRDEFVMKYNVKDALYPSAYLVRNNQLTLIISQDEMNSVKDLDEMEALVLNKLSKSPYITNILT
ncbi:MAG: hypothetical protein ACFE8B_02150 [Candidatus Hermodarchaeota archaeon]